MKGNRRKMGYMTIYRDVEVEIDMCDIISCIGDFDTNDLEDLRDAVVREIGENDSVVFEAENLEDEQKIKILKEFFNKYTWEELEKIKKEYGKGL